MSFAASAIAIGTAAYGAISSKNAATASSAAATIATQKQMKLSAASDTASRQAQANSMAAQLESNEFQVAQLERNKQTLTLQAKADTLFRSDSYNEQMAVGLVMGAASGRTTNSGSISAIFDKSEENFNFETLWNDNNLKQSMANISRDQYQVYRAGAVSAKLGAESLGVNRLRSQAGQEQLSSSTYLSSRSVIDASNARNIQSIGGAMSGAARAYGNKYGSIFGPKKTANISKDNGWLY